MAMPAGPVRGRDRVFEVDVLRGFALLGILLVNMDGFAWPITESRLGWHDSVHLADRVAGWLIRVLAQGKFFTLFSLLFGFGLATQMLRAEARGARFLPAYLRRLAVLMGFGLLHLNVLWAGDILTDYAILGLALLAFRRCRPAVLAVWSVAALGISLAAMTFISWPMQGALGTLAGSPALASPAPAYAEAPAAVEAPAAAVEARVGGTSEYRHRAIDIYRHGTFAEMRARRLFEARKLQINGIVFEPIVFAMFLLGLALGKARIAERIRERVPLIRRLAGWAAGVGIIANLAFVVLEDATLGAPSAAGVVSGVGFIVGAPVLMLAYVAGLALLLQQPVWRARLAPLAAAGRMPLSNYLGQSVICTTIFYGYGLGLFGRIGVAAGVGLTIVIYLALVALSAWWMRRFEFGPLEWVWRTLTYGPRFPAAVSGRRPEG